MKVAELIKELYNYPQDLDVTICDINKNVREDMGLGDGSSEGIYPEFTVDFLGEDQVPEGANQFIALTFVSEEDDEQG